MAIKTSTFSVNDAGDPEAVTATIQCIEVSIVENAQQPTTDFDIYSEIGGTPARKMAGQIFTFPQSHDVGQPRRYNPGEVLGYVATAAGTATFQKIEVY